LSPEELRELARDLFDNAEEMEALGFPDSLCRPVWLAAQSVQRQAEGETE
jgi:hypothetical protein